ncbi:MAG: hypothetical protein GOU98_01495 [Candidatus Altiarchaeota archaeon]|nr:hypothetical protein [Candidatus Altiarchaeota archaeon]
MRKLLALIILLSPFYAQQTHPLSEITPVDTNLAMGSYSLTATGLTLSKSGYSSIITFPATTNDPGYINHTEYANNARLELIPGDDWASNDMVVVAGSDEADAIIMRTDGYLGIEGQLYDLSDSILTIGDSLTVTGDLVVSGTGTSTIGGDLTVSGTGTTTITGDLTVSGTSVTLPANTIDAGEVNFNYADSTSEGGAASDLACTDCVASGEVEFNYAGSDTEGGGANSCNGDGTCETGAIKHTGSLISDGVTYDNTWMTFTEILNGNSLILGAGGLTAIGAGESAGQVSANIAASTETLYLASDNNIVFVTKLQDGWATRVDAGSINNVGNWATTGDLTVNGGDISIANNNGGIGFNDVDAYWLKTATNWGIYWKTNTENQIQFHGAGVNKGYIDLDNGNMQLDGDLYLDGGDLVLNDVIIHSDGTKIGIADSTPSYTLDVAGTGRFTTSLAVNGPLTLSDGTDQGTLYFRSDRTDTKIDESGYVLRMYAPSGLSFYPDSNGNNYEHFRIYNGAGTATFDLVENSWGGATVSIIGEVRTLEYDGSGGRVWGEGRSASRRYGTSGIESGLCTNGDIQFGLSYTATTFGASAAACPHGTWVCSYVDRGAGVGACNTARPDWTDDGIYCSGSSIDFTSTNHVGWTSSWDGSTSSTVEAIAVKEINGAYAIWDTCTSLPVWCCS